MEKEILIIFKTALFKQLIKKNYQLKLNSMNIINIYEVFEWT